MALVDYCFCTGGSCFLCLVVKDVAKNYKPTVYRSYYIICA